MTDNAIVTENLTKVYGKLTAVDHVTLNVASGTVFGLLGPNGAGKTTMIKLLTGLAYFGLKDRRKDRVKTFSTGMRKKLEIALALLHQPEVVFMDEPTIGLDANTRRMLWDLITGVNKEFGITVLLTSHYIEEADAL